MLSPLIAMLPMERSHTSGRKTYQKIPLDLQNLYQIFHYSNLTLTEVSHNRPSERIHRPLSTAADSRFDFFVVNRHTRFRRCPSPFAVASPISGLGTIIRSHTCITHRAPQPSNAPQPASCVYVVNDSDPPSPSVREKNLSTASSGLWGPAAEHTAGRRVHEVERHGALQLPHRDHAQRWVHTSSPQHPMGCPSSQGIASFSRTRTQNLTRQHCVQLKFITSPTYSTF